jgi:hypothetical protein
MIVMLPIKAALSGNNALKDKAVSKAVEMGFIRREDDAKDRRRKVLFPAANGGLDV